MLDVENTANNYATIIEKDELVKAIQLIRMSKEYGPSIDERWTTATEQSYMCHRAYNRGYQDGVEKEHARISTFVKGLFDILKKHAETRPTMCDTSDILTWLEEERNYILDSDKKED